MQANVCPDCGHERKCVIGQYYQCPVCDIDEIVPVDDSPPEIHHIKLSSGNSDYIHWGPGGPSPFYTFSSCPPDCDCDWCLEDTQP